MPVTLFLNDAQMDVVDAATKSKDIKFKTAGRSTIYLTGDNWQAIRDAITELHNKKFSIRSKTVDHLETCYYAQEVLKKIQALETDLTSLPVSNDNKVGIVTTPFDKIAAGLVDAIDVAAEGTLTEETPVLNPADDAPTLTEEIATEATVTKGSKSGNS